MFTRAVARWVGGVDDADYPEPWPAFRARCGAALDGLAGALASARPALVFTSGGPIAVLASQLLRVDAARVLDLQWGLVNCGVTKIVTGRRGLRVASLNEHGHFEGARARLITYR